MNRTLGEVVIDCEIYPNFSLFAFYNLNTTEYSYLEIKTGENICRKLFDMMSRYVTIGFNSICYDLPIIQYALKGATTGQLFQLSCSIINGNTPGWKLMGAHSFNHIDLKNLCPPVSLKLLGARLGVSKIQDLPFDPMKTLSEEQKLSVRKYCFNDLFITKTLHDNLMEKLRLRVDMSKQFLTDLRSKSDAQIVETIFKKYLGNISKYKSSGKSVFYKAPSFLKFESPELKDLFKLAQTTSFSIGKDKIIISKDLANYHISMGHIVFKLGIGGLHSQERRRYIIPKDNELLINMDVVSYYPSIILKLGLFPSGLGVNFLDLYRKFKRKRVIAKRSNNVIEANMLKIIINGCFGKFGSPYSIFYDPGLLITVTLTGQFILLNLIEQLELNNIDVVSANTDGLTIVLPKNHLEKLHKVTNKWKTHTGLELDETYYKGLYSRDVNNYVAIAQNNVYFKGIFADLSIMKNPQAAVSIQAAREYMINRTHPRIFIQKMKDCPLCKITLFIQARTVTGGAFFQDDLVGDYYLGKVVRWIYVKEGGIIRYVKNNNKVPKSNNSLPLMTLPQEIPIDIDVDRYVEESLVILGDVGIDCTYI